MSRFCFLAKDETDTERLGAAMAGAARAGDVIALNGDLGAGKTRLVRAVAASLHGTDSDVSSPTFIIAQRYDGRIPIDHIDAYRLADGDEFLALGGEEILIGDAVCFIEWAERISEVLPQDHVHVNITVISPTSREFELTGRGERSNEFVLLVKQGLAS